ncbi:uncharacterized protein GIQ15_05742 [Arthroderma uncinatum]|uniref:uncharacterized protein n=1 Tax=Arthroderma uncinatum TaxID=74035 RepID=UPI00144AE6F9|nr:uncharacterized protein GIQ15_05742 [Arthroderma uncinatum]KAF3480395.1 hypothetical protein GIQ15_05742 [Arthroderma uncinatum]
MPIRLARYSDLDAISSTLAEGFHSEEVMGPILHPYRQEYPDDYLNYWRRQCLEKWWDYSYIFVVSYLEEHFEDPDKRDRDGDNPNTQEDVEKETREDMTNRKPPQAKREVITGVAQWHRMGPGWEAIWKPAGKWDPRVYITSLISLYHKYFLNVMFPNRAASKPPQITEPLLRKALIKAIGSFYTSPPHRQTNWALSVLAVRPGYQKHGHGRELVAWGLDKAREDCIPASVLSAKGKDTFYRRCGFTELVGWATDGEDNPLKGLIEGGAVMFTRVKEDDA